MELEELRKKIDLIDKKLVALYVKRLALSREVGLYKKFEGVTLEHKSREAEIVKNLSVLAGADGKYVADLYEEIFRASKKVQADLKGNYYVVGKSLPHTLSPEIYTKLGLDYGVKEFGDEQSLVEFIRSREFSGLNVTIPYKQTVIPELDFVSEEAGSIGAVNTIVNRGGKLYGYNTDVDGMRYALDALGISLKGKKVAILGSGGTSKTATYVAKTAGANEIKIVSRSGDYNYDSLYSDADAEIIINTTPVGMFPNIESAPVDLERLPSVKGVFDAVYNPLTTKLVRTARERGIAAGNGLGMLVRQGIKSYEYYTGEMPEEYVTHYIYDSIYRAKRNVVLIGMPGAGKSSVARRIANMTGRVYLDTDEVVKERFGRTPAEIITEEGEAEFRKKETECVISCAEKLGAVIATGGGSVLSERNRNLLKANGAVIFLDRNIDELSTRNRPISGARGVKAIYEEREPIYRSYADVTVKSAESAQATANKIVDLLGLSDVD